MASFDDSVRRLVELSRELNDRTDRLNDRIAAAEQELRAGGLGTQYWLQEELIGHPPDGESRTFHVGWDRIRNGWAFCIEFDGEDQYRCLLDSPRWVRAVAFPRLGELVERLTKYLESTLRSFPPLPDDSPDPPRQARELPAPEDDIPF